MFDYKEVVGNLPLIKNLKSSIKNSHVSHAYIFEGESGLGKYLMAKCYAKSLLCEKGGESPCGKCSSCLSFDSDNNPDVIMVRPTKNKSIGVDDIREQVHKEIALKPYKYNYKVFIIKDCEKLSVQAQNALLKVLEEPYHYGVFLLTVGSIGSLLPTILSRCIVFKMKTNSPEDVENYLFENFEEITKEKAKFISNYTGGSIGMARNAFIDEKFSIVREKAIKVFYGINRRELIDVFTVAKEFEEMKENVNEALEIGIMWFRDLAILKELQDEEKVLQIDILDKLKKEVSEISINSIYKNIEIILETKYNLKYNANFQLSMEVMLMKMNDNK